MKWAGLKKEAAQLYEVLKRDAYGTMYIANPSAVRHSTTITMYMSNIFLT